MNSLLNLDEPTFQTVPHEPLLRVKATEDQFYPVMNVDVMIFIVHHQEDATWPVVQGQQDGVEATKERSTYREL